ncbi:hypothetical protein T07_8239, partial [Trichinella nelsoni]
LLSTSSLGDNSLYSMFNNISEKDTLNATFNDASFQRPSQQQDVCRTFSTYQNITVFVSVPIIEKNIDVQENSADIADGTDKNVSEDFVAVIDPSVATTAIETPSNMLPTESSAIFSGSVCMLNGHSDVLMDDADDPAPSTRIALSDVELLQEEEISQNLNDLFTFLFPSSPARRNVMYQYNTSEFDSDLDKCYENFVKKSSDLKATAAEDWKKKNVKEFMVTLLKEEIENLNYRSKLANLASTSLTPVETDSADSGTNDADGSAIDLDVSSISLLDIFSFGDSDDNENYDSIRSNMKCNNLVDVATDYAD